MLTAIIVPAVTLDKVTVLLLMSVTVVLGTTPGAATRMPNVTPVTEFNAIVLAPTATELVVDGAVTVTNMEPPVEVVEDTFTPKAMALPLAITLVGLADIVTMFPLTKVTFAVPEILACCTSIPGMIPALEESMSVDTVTGMLAEVVRVTAVWKNGSPSAADAELLAFVAITDGVLKFAWLT